MNIVGASEGCVTTLVGCENDEQTQRLAAGPGQDGPEGAAAHCEPEALYEEDATLPSWLTVRKGHVYWIDDRTQELSRIPTEGGARQPIARGLGPGWASIASDEEHLFVAGAEGQIRRIALDGSEDIVLAASGGDTASAIQLGDSYAYWLSATGGPVGRDFVAQVRRARVDGSGPAEVLWNSDPLTFSSGLAAGGGYLFVDVFNWAYPNELEPDGQILRLSETTGDTVPLATGLLVPRVEGADDRYVYFSAQTEERYSELWRVAIAGGSPELIQPGTFETSVNVGQMLIQGDNVWWGEANRVGGALHLNRANVTTRDVVPVVTLEAHHMLGLSSDDRYLYFSSSYSFDAIGPAAIWRLGRECPTN
jgi:hypothetical protein